MTKQDLQTENTMTVKDLRRLLGLTGNGVYALLKSGKLAGFRTGATGRVWRVTESEVRRYMKSKGQPV